jgi:hypothetical protein
MTNKLELSFANQLYDKQHEAIFCTERYAIIEASTKSGKTMACLSWLLTKATEKSGIYWWVAPQYSQSLIAFNRLHEALRHGAAYAIDSVNESTHTIKLVNGSRIEFKSGEKSDGLFGEDVDACVIDEASRLREESFHAIRSTLTATQGSLRIIGNVTGRRNWMYKLAREAEAGRDNWKYSRLTWTDAVDAGVLMRAEVDDAKAMLPAHVFQELYEAQATDDGSNPFRMESIEQCIKPMSDLEPEVWGWDLAKSVDYTVGIALDRNNQVCRLERFQNSWDVTEEIILSHVNNEPCLIDSSGVGDPIVERLSKDRWTIEGFKFTSTSKQQIIEGLILAIQNHEIGFPEGPIVSELMNFGYEHTRTGMRYESMSGHDDAVMALALAHHQKKNMPSQGIWFS